MKYKISESELRTYSVLGSCVFKKNNEKFGQLSNMATGFPLRINNVRVKTSEALYQALRFPDNFEVQRRILEEASPMKVKMISNSFKNQSRSDWDEIRIKIMKWCINVKFSQNVLTFGEVLNSTGSRDIVENSSSDNFWGAILNPDGNYYVGKNALGRLLMELREKFHSRKWLELLYIEPPAIDNLMFLGEEIKIIDERTNYLKSLVKYWEIDQDVLKSLSDDKKEIFFNLGLNLNNHQKGLF